MACHWRPQATSSARSTKAGGRSRCSSSQARNEAAKASSSAFSARSMVILEADIEVTLVGWRDRVRAVTAHLRATWVPSRARHYRRPGGPWQVPTLDALLSAWRRRGGRRRDPARRRRRSRRLVASVAGGLRARGVRRGEAVAWQVPNSLAAAVLSRACWRLGAVAAPVLHSFGAADVEKALAQVEPRLVVELAPDALSDPVGARARRWAARRWRPGRARPGPRTWPWCCSPRVRPGCPRRCCTRTGASAGRPRSWRRCTGSAPATPC